MLQYRKVIFVFLVLVPSLVFSQSKRKKAKLLALQQKKEQLALDSLVSQLQTHTNYLADDKLQGRRAGTEGEKMAAAYLAANYQAIGLEPAGTNGFFQEFDIDEGKTYKTANTKVTINKIQLKAEEDFFVLPYSAIANVKSTTATALRESNEVWVIDLKDALEENKTNPHFSLEEWLKMEVEKHTKNEAKGIIVTNTGKENDGLIYNAKDKSAVAKIPVVYIHKAAYNKWVKDAETSFDVAMSINFEPIKRKATNLVGFINNNAANTVIIGAHYDHLGFGEDKNALDSAKEIHNGADDNASGSAALLTLAKWLNNNPSTANNNYLIMHFSAEELGLLGSKYWLQNPTKNITPNYMINMDMVGRYDTTKKLTIGGFGTSPTWGNILTNVKTNLIYKLDSTGGGPSDHASFYRANIPVLFFFTGSHSDYHKASDDFEKINYQGQAQIVQLIKQVITLTNNENKLSFLKTAEPIMGKSSKFTVSLGVIPDYGYSGVGVRIDGVSPGKLAQKMGLQAGDILLTLGEINFTDVMSYMTALSKFKKGDATKLTIKRGNENLVFDVVF